MFSHSQKVKSVAWLAGGEVVVSIGGDDLAILQWRVHGDIQAAQKHASNESKLLRAQAQVVLVVVV